MSTPTASQTAAHGPAHAELDRMWGELAPVGRDGGSGGYRRFAWTREDATLREWFAGECARRGLDVVEDRAGNQWAWWGDVDAARAAESESVAEPVSVFRSRVAGRISASALPANTRRADM